MDTVGIKFGDLIPGQIFSYNSQFFVKIFPTEGHNAAELGIKWEEKVYGTFEDECLVSADPDQLPASVPHIVVKQETFDQLVDDSNFLSSLEGAGVDNWEGYGFAVEDYQSNS